MEQLQKKKKVEEMVELQSEDKKLFNLLEIRLYDLSQTLEIISKQLTNNQVKDIVSQSFNISQQLKVIFSHCKVPFLYNILRKMQVNSVLVTNLLTERLQKQKTNGQATCKCQLSEASQELSKPQVHDQNKKQTRTQSKIPALGGVHLYNENHTRKLSYLESIDDAESRGKKQNSKNGSEFLKSLMEEINNKAEVQVDGIRDEIKSYILNYKECTKVANFISCETQINQIIDFFKTSQRQAVKFLSKAPNQNLEFSDDYISRLDDLERDIKGKQSTQKDQSIQKLKVFIGKLKQKVAEIQKLYEQKNTELVEYEKRLKKVTNEIPTQTHDGYYRKLKELQSKIKQLEERNSILNDIRKSQSLFMVQINNLTHNLHLKINENKKLGHTNLQLEDQLHGLKKLIRENHQKTAPLKQLERKKRKLVSKGALDSSPNETPSHLDQNQTITYRQHRNQRKMKKFDRAISQGNHHIRASYQADDIRTSDFKVSQKYIEQRGSEQNNSSNYLGIPRIKSMDQGQSVFKNQFRKTVHPKRTLEGDRQVSFQVVHGKNQSFTQLLSRENDDLIEEKSKEKSLQNSRSLISIDGQFTRRSTKKKSTLKQRIDTPTTSIKNLQNEEGKKSWSRIPSKKCIILKENKEKSIIPTMMKIQRFDIERQYNINLEFKANFSRKYQQNTKRLERISHPMPNSVKESSIDKKNQNLDIFKPNKKMRSKKDLKKKATQGTLSGEVDRTTSTKSISDFEDTKVKKSFNKNIEQSKLIKDKNNNFLNQNNASQTFSKYHPINIEEDPQEQQITTKMNTTAPGKLQKESIKKFFKIQSEDNPKLPQKFKKLLKNIEIRKNEDGQSSMKRKQSKKDEGYELNDLMLQLQQENLSIDEFKQTMIQISEESPVISQILQNQYRQIDAKENSGSLKPQNSIYKSSASLDKFKTLKQHIFADIQNISKQSALLEKCTSEEEIKQYWILRGISVDTISKIHSRFGKCSSIQGDNKICHHVHSYLNIINKINQGQASNKIALKLPVEKIGVNEQKGDKYKKNERTTDKSFGTYLKSHQTTEDRNKEKGTLPLINSSTTSFYKPKSKLNR